MDCYSVWMVLPQLLYVSHFYHLRLQMFFVEGEKSFAAMTEMQERCNHQQNVPRCQRPKMENVVDLKGTPLPETNKTEK